MTHEAQQPQVYINKEMHLRLTHFCPMDSSTPTFWTGPTERVSKLYCYMYYVLYKLMNLVQTV